jgi:methionyl aminopeptidase
MNEVIRECYMEAGNIAALVRNEALSRVKEGRRLLGIAEYAEKRIRDLGANPAFPCNISINEVASHYTPSDDMPCFKKGDVVKIDLGAHVEGYIADTAVTIEIGTNSHIRLIKACEEALENAILHIRDDVRTGTIGKIIENTIRKYGFNSVRDLTGHSMEQYKLHAGATIPNFASPLGHKIRKDMVFAVEPFATYGKGSVRYGKPHIFAVKEASRNKNHLKVKEMFGTLPFAWRWVPGMKLEDGLHEYPEIIESDDEIVVQAEHTLIVNENGCEVITR